MPANPTATPPMRELDFLTGEWDLRYTATQRGVTTTTIRGTGSIRYLFGETYLRFDYRTLDVATGVSGEAFGVFAWDTTNRRYLFHWFESSGAFRRAIGTLRGPGTLALEWEGGDCSQVFQRVDGDAMFLEMRCAAQDVFLRVDFSRKPTPRGA